jgi:hypothetical protein
MAEGWKQAWRCFHQEGAAEAPAPEPRPGRVTRLVLDMRSTFLRREDPATFEGEALTRWHRWTPFHERMGGLVIPTPRRPVEAFRAGGHLVVFARTPAEPPCKDPPASCWPSLANLLAVTRCGGSQGRARIHPASNQKLARRRRE